MARDEWFRNRTWSPSIEAQFLARLSRSRSAQHRAQYLRIQAIELAGAGTKALTGQALALLERHLAEFSDPYERTQAHAAAADCCDKLDRVDSAIVHFRASLSEGTRAPNLDCGVRIGFPWFIVSRRLINLYSEALELLPLEPPVFPVERFKVSTVRAVVAESRGQLEDARRHSQDALSTLDQPSPFARHPGLGLVEEAYAEAVRWLRQRAAA